jgi:uncharacterized protein (DUF4213/DUF364 family)
MDLLIEARDKLIELIPEKSLLQTHLQITARGLSAIEAIGQPSRGDYPILNGKEVMIEAECGGAYGQAFTDEPRSYQGTLDEVLHLPLDTSANRALLVAALNAVLRKLNLATRTTHCKNEEPEQCSASLMVWLKERVTSGDKIGLIGLQPAMLEQLSTTFGGENILASDLNPATIGTQKWGVTILDGATDNQALIDAADLVLVTGSSIVNGSFNALHQYMTTTQTSFAAFGNTISGVACLLAIPHVCFFGR